MVLEELQECRTLAEVEAVGLQAHELNHWRRARDRRREHRRRRRLHECGRSREDDAPDWDGTVYVFTRGTRPSGLVI
jgi:hypothetical protein